MIAPDDFDRPFGDTTARELVKLTTSCDSATPPGTFNPSPATSATRATRSSGTPPSAASSAPASTRSSSTSTASDEDAAAYILDQFPVLEKNERREHGRYLSKELVLGHYRALAAATPTPWIAEQT